jgi:hypothetical protein
MTEHQVLLKKQKNELFRIIEEVGLEPSNFEWVEERVKGPQTDHVISKLVYRDLPYFYRFDVTMTRYLCKKCPGLQKTTGLAKFTGWSSVVADFAHWAKRLKAEIEAPDLWAEAQKYQSIFLVSTTEQIQEIPFSHAEAEQIASAFKEVETRIIREFDPAPEPLGFVQDKLSYLVSKAKEGYPRIDWVNILIGVMTSMAVVLSLSPEQARRLWAFHKQVLGSAVRLSV